MNKRSLIEQFLNLVRLLSTHTQPCPLLYICMGNQRGKGRFPHACGALEDQETMGFHLLAKGSGELFPTCYSIRQRRRGRLEVHTLYAREGAHSHCP